MIESFNIARHLPLMAARQPDVPAIKVPRGRINEDRIDYLELSFRELDAEVDAWVAHLAARGVHRGDRVLVMVRQGLPLIAAAFALFKLGAVPVIIDPGMGRKNFLACVARSKPRVLLGIPLAQVMSHLFRSAFATVEVRAWVNSSPTARAPESKIENQKPHMVNSAAADLAAVLFTSGSTGAPKGVCYEHGMFDAQVRLVRDTYGIKPGEVDMPMLPIFALFNPALGMTTIVPELDPARPASVDPVKIAHAIQQEKVTNSFGSPTLWRIIFDHCLTYHLTLPSVRRVLCAGAAVPASVWSDAQRILTNGVLHSPYGATEALPICSASYEDVLGRPGRGSRPPGSKPSFFEIPTAAQGALVGHPLPANHVKIIALHDGPLATLDDARELPPGQIGEIIVTGPTVTKDYDGLPDATALAKIQTPEPKIPTKGEITIGAEPIGVWNLTTPGAVPPGAVWHRMGDAGYLDEAGRLWFCGRIAERVVTRTTVMHTEPIERVFRGYPGVARCALVGVGEPGQQEPVLVVQPVKPLSSAEKKQLMEELRALALQQPHTVAVARFLFHPSLPVDVRHNAKIHRLTLAKWAATQIGHSSP